MRKAFTLVEVGVVLAMLAVLVVLLYPSLKAVQQAAKKAHDARVAFEAGEKAALEAETKWGDATEFARRQIEEARSRAEQEAREAPERIRQEAERLKKELRDKFAADAWWWIKAAASVLSLMLAFAVLWPPVSRAVASVVIRRTAPPPRHILPVDEERK
jgi:prepilin-type N-terminal cleavage/methylation domain-containing protein